MSTLTRSSNMMIVTPGAMDKLTYKDRFDAHREHKEAEVEVGERSIFTKHKSSSGEIFLIITRYSEQWSRLVTTILLPSEVQ